VKETATFVLLGAESGFFWMISGYFTTKMPLLGVDTGANSF
jgi:hypothetical protein